MIAEPLYSSMDGTSAKVIADILRVLFPDAHTLYDPTWGKGKFYPTIPVPLLYGSDKDLTRAKDWCADFRNLPLEDAAIDVVVFDPPFQPLSTNTSQLIGSQYSKVGQIGKSMANLEELKQLVIAGAREAFRVCKQGCIIKSQDYVHARKRVLMSAWIHEALGQHQDHVTLRQRSKLRSSSWKHQYSVWTNHSDFWVYLKGSRYHKANRVRPAA